MGGWKADNFTELLFTDHGSLSKTSDLLRAQRLEHDCCTRV